LTVGFWTPAAAQVARSWRKVAPFGLLAGEGRVPISSAVERTRWGERPHHREGALTRPRFVSYVGLVEDGYRLSRVAAMVGVDLLAVITVARMSWWRSS
jgi:hypothetical protein